jgi:6-phosphogluconate dehydrogenase
MKLAMIGLGKMGGYMSQRLIEGGHEVVAYDISKEAVDALAAKGATGAASLEQAVSLLAPPRVAWVMLPDGPPTHDSVVALSRLMEPGDVIVDGGNTNYREHLETLREISNTGVALVDAGTSGGIWGLTEGYCLMVGGEREAVTVAEPAFLTLAPEGGYAHVGPPGAGHFVKMVHNGIEYGLMQAYAEGFEIMAAAKEFDLDLHQVSSIWRYGSVVRSWLLELIERSLADQEEFASIEGVVPDTGEGRWTVQEAVERAVPAPVITTALFARFASRDPNSIANRLVSAMRHQFGGHAVVKRD